MGQARDTCRRSKRRAAVQGNNTACQVPQQRITELEREIDAVYKVNARLVLEKVLPTRSKTFQWFTTV